MSGPTSYFCSFRLQDSISPDLTIASASEQPTLCNRTDVTIAADQPPTVDIDKEGDVLLAVGDPIEIQLRVSSAILSKTSKVFAALFSPR